MPLFVFNHCSRADISVRNTKQTWTEFLAGDLYLDVVDGWRGNASIGRQLEPPWLDHAAAAPNRIVD
jgi:hypothetical protein